MMETNLIYKQISELDPDTMHEGMYLLEPDLYHYRLYTMAHLSHTCSAA